MVKLCRLTFLSRIGTCAVFCGLFSSATLVAQPAIDKNAPNPGASIRFEQTTHDLGLIPAGTLIKREIVFTNHGTADLTIREISHTCSCTTTPEWTRVTPPKGKGRILVEFHAMALSGAIQKTIAVHTNDPVHPITTLTLQGVVKHVLEATPSVAVMKAAGLPSRELSAVVLIINHTDQPITLQNPVSDHKQFRARLETITEGKEFRLIVTAQPPFPVGILSANMTIATTSAEMPALKIPAAVLTAPELIVHPPHLYLPITAPDAATPHLITIRTQTPQPISITHVSCDAPGSSVTIREITAGKEFELSVRFPKELYSSTHKTYTITAQTSAPGQQSITIPVSFARAPSFPPPSP